MKKIEWNGTMINELLVNGNSKIGKSVYHFSTLPGTAGTCFMDCPGCYGKTGNYRYASVKNALATRTEIVKTDLVFFVNEIIREIKSHKIEFVRIHATGDFFSSDYVKAWIEIATACKATVFWTYTKAFGHGFDNELNTLNSMENVNIVSSMVPGFGMNFGHCDYVMEMYNDLTSKGENPYICKCGIDDTVHCNECHKCAERKYVLFLEHSTGYKAEKDPLYINIKDLINNQ